MMYQYYALALCALARLGKYTIYTIKQFIKLFWICWNWKTLFKYADILGCAIKCYGSGTNSKSYWADYKAELSAKLTCVEEADACMTISYNCSFESKSA